MAKSYRQFLMAVETYEELIALRERLSLNFFQVGHSLGVGVVVKILIDHAANVPPDYDWLKAQAEKAPKRGRPRRSDPNFIPEGKRRYDKLGHSWVSPAARADIGVCRHCDDVRHRDSPTGRGYPCKKNNPWTKAELLALTFTTEEVAWAHG